MIDEKQSIIIFEGEELTTEEKDIIKKSGFYEMVKKEYASLLPPTLVNNEKTRTWHVDRSWIENGSQLDNKGFLLTNSFLGKLWKIRTD